MRLKDGCCVKVLSSVHTRGVLLAEAVRRAVSTTLMLARILRTKYKAMTCSVSAFFCSVPRQVGSCLRSFTWVPNEKRSSQDLGRALSERGGGEED